MSTQPRRAKRTLPPKARAFSVGSSVGTKKVAHREQCGPPRNNMTSNQYVKKWMLVLVGLKPTTNRLWAQANHRRRSADYCPAGSVPSIGTAWASAVTVASCGPVPSMIAANVPGGMNASGARRPMCFLPCLHAPRSRRKTERVPMRYRRSTSAPWRRRPMMPSSRRLRK
jgi:hypothetical protein